MNANAYGPEQSQSQDLVLLLPGLGDRDLPEGRHDHHKDILMQLIDRDQNPAVTAEARRASPRRRLRTAIVVPFAATALVAATLGVVTVAGHAPDPAPRPVATGPGGATRLLDRIAAVAMTTGQNPVSARQFVYVRSQVAMNVGMFNGPITLGAVHERQIWLSQDPAPDGANHGLIREDGDDYPIVSPAPDGSKEPGGIPAGIDRPTYQWFASLPTDPAVLLKQLYAQTPADEFDDHDQAVFNRIGELLSESVMPAATAGALYHAVAMIPGVSEDADAVDAAGRHGIAVARTNLTYSEREAWIFDRSSLAYLGRRSYLVKDTDRGPAGTVTATSAVLQRAVVDRLGVEPAPSAD